MLVGKLKGNGMHCDRTRFRTAKMSLLFWLVATLAASPAFSLDPMSSSVDKTSDLATGTDAGLRNGNLVVAPIPFSNEAVGGGAALGVGYLFSFPGSRPSGFGLGYVETSNGSNGYGIGGSFVFDDNRWTITAAGVDGQVNYDLPIGTSVSLPLAQEVTGATVKLEYGFSNSLKSGVGITYLNSQIRLNSDLGGVLPPSLEPDLDVELVRLTFDVVYDTRDDTFFPRSGSEAVLKLFYGHIQDSVVDGLLVVSDRTYFKVLGKYSTFIPVGEKDVVGINGVICGADSDAPFFDGCGVGFADGMRGFSSLGALSDWSTSTQIEYRGRISERIGYAVFAGAGAGGDDPGSLSFDNGGFAAGIGLRYRLSKKFGLDYTVDYARNDKGDGFFYVSIGQGF